MRLARRLQLLLLLPVVALAPMTAAAQTPAPSTAQAGRIAVEVTGMRSSRGSVRCVLYGGPRQFPEGSVDVVRRVRVQNDGRVARCLFEGLSLQHDYAVVIHHDEDDDGTFARGTFGIPLEGYAFSNNVRPVLSAPTFGDCCVHLRASELRLAVTMRY